ncbi:MAG: DNA-binding protein [Desulfurococcales archaeon]|nr:DNA-binding protein [Desulfurococcales archaeon]
MSNTSILELNIGQKPLEEYLLEAITAYQSGIETIVIKGRGFNICKAVDLYNDLLERLGEDAFRVEDVKIGTERVRDKGRTVPRSFIIIKLRPTSL